jgi:hypothetical protein
MITLLPANMQTKIQLQECAVGGLDPTCWIWTGAVTSRGYGSVSYERRIWSSHKLAYVLLVGPVPDGLTLDHLCLIKRCCNPSHLEPVTNAENIRRGRASNFAQYGSYFPHFDRICEYAQAKPRASLSSADYTELRRLAARGEELPEQQAS